MADLLLVLGIGSNLGNRQEFLAKAQANLEKDLGKLLAASGVFETEPWGVENHPPYLNQILVYQTQLQPEKILRIAQALEVHLGRSQKGLLQARTIDIDLLFYGQEKINSDELVIPHPRLTERRFVLEPLCQVLPHFIHPQNGRPVSELLLSCQDQGKIWPYVSEEWSLEIQDAEKR
jgi:2-amino-4-hydroxy-6-hydroxymethyldihydropteridine diphosphokinase